MAYEVHSEYIFETADLKSVVDAADSNGDSHIHITVEYESQGSKKFNCKIRATAGNGNKLNSPPPGGSDGCPNPPSC